MFLMKNVFKLDASVLLRDTPANVPKLLDHFSPRLGSEAEIWFSGASLMILCSFNNIVPKPGPFCQLCSMPITKTMVLLKRSSLFQCQTNMWRQETLSQICLTEDKV